MIKTSNKTAPDINLPGLRPQTNADKNFLLELYISIHQAGLLQTSLLQSGWSQAEIHTLLTQQFETQQLAYRQRFPQAAFQLITLDTQAIGRLYLNRGEKEYRIIDISLLPKYQNQKLGSHLIQSIQHEATLAGNPLSLHVETLNPAYNLYKRLGFVHKEDRGTHSLMEWRPDISG